MINCAASAGMPFLAIHSNGYNSDDWLSITIMKTKHVIIAASRSTNLGINEIMPVVIYAQSYGFLLFLGGKTSSNHF